MEIKVFLSRSSEKPVFCRIIQTVDGLDIDYSLLLRSMRILYGNECLVEFKIYPL